jgi:hypothetical protein
MPINTGSTEQEINLSKSQEFPIIGNNEQQTTNEAVTSITTTPLQVSDIKAEQNIEEVVFTL